jgi:hypothetical protein
MKNLFIILLSFILLQSCDFGERDQVVTVADTYSLTIPAFLSKVDHLNDDASLQYQNIWNEFYVIVIDEPKEDFQEFLDFNEDPELFDNVIEIYSHYTFDVFKESISSARQTDWVSTNVNDMPAILTTLTGTHNGVDIFFNYGIFEGRESFYQVIVWTLGSKKLKYKPRMDQILHSLQEI